jgi:LuxR family transcriptional regulator, maltose regulon positive regulatory protein
MGVGAAPVPSLNAAIHWLHLGSAYRLTGRMEEAVNAYQETIRLARLSGSLLQTVYALHNLAALYEVCAELDRAYDSYYEIIRLAASTPLPNAGLGDLGVGKVLRERNQLDEAEAHLRKAALSGRRHRIDGVIADSSITLALVSIARRDWQAAQAYLNDAREVVQHWQQGISLLRLRTFEARFALLRGDLAAAERWRDEAGVSVNDEPTDNDAIEQIMLARLLIARGDIQPALSFIARLLQKAESDGRAAQVIELLNLRALANDAAERESEARAALNQALALAQPGGCIRVFLDEGERLIELLQLAVRSGGEGADYARVVLNAAQRPTAKAQPAAASSSHELVETLSERELEVLGLVAEGLTNQEIADRLYLARATVKKHIENIFGKLLVNNRTQAVTRARELGLL